MSCQLYVILNEIIMGLTEFPALYTQAYHAHTHSLLSLESWSGRDKKRTRLERKPGLLVHPVLIRRTGIADVEIPGNLGK